MPRKKNIIVANWKMNPSSLEEAKLIWNSTKKVAKTLKNSEVVVSPPFPLLSIFSKSDTPKNLYLGAQNIASEEKGAFTGEVGAPIIRDLGASFVIIGHSERRKMGEDNVMVRKKIDIAINNKLEPIVCIGENFRDHSGEHLAFLKNQIKECFSGLEKKHLLGMLLAYEPVWAIGKSYKESMSPTDIHESTLFIQKVFGEIFGRDTALSLKILYGGSIEVENAKAIMEYGNVSGFLVGHASVSLEDFPKILKEADIKRV